MLEEGMDKGFERYSREMLAADWAPVSDTVYRNRSRRYKIRPAPGPEFGAHVFRRSESAAEPGRAAQPEPQVDDEPEPAGLIQRLRQRKMVQWLIAYLAMAAIVLQLTEALAEMWAIPVPLQRCISLGLAFGTLPALVVAWYHGELGRQRVTASEVGIVAALLIGTGLSIWRVCWF